MKSAPCLKCTERHPGCHAKCTKDGGYLQWKAERDKIMSEHKKEADIERQLTDSFIKRLYNATLERGRRGKR